MSDFNKYKLRINLKSAVMFEQFVGRSFYTMGEDPEDYLKYMYCCLVANNDSLLMDYSTFLVLAGDKKTMNWITNQFKTLEKFNSQFSSLTNQEDEKSEDVKVDDNAKPVMMSDVAASLIIQYKMDANYVMYDMGLYEIKPYLNCAENVKKAEMVEKRFWTYLQIMPHVDGKKLKKPEQLVSFEWEKGEVKKRAEEDLKNNMTGIKSLIGKKFDWIK